MVAVIYGRSKYKGERGSPCVRVRMCASDVRYASTRGESDVENRRWQMAVYVVFSLLLRSRLTLQLRTGRAHRRVAHKRVVGIVVECNMLVFLVFCNFGYCTRARGRTGACCADVGVRSSRGGNERTLRTAVSGNVEDGKPSSVGRTGSVDGVGPAEETGWECLMMDVREWRAGHDPSLVRFFLLSLCSLARPPFGAHFRVFVEKAAE